MLKFILDRHVIYVLMGVSAFLGVAAKVVVSTTFRKLVTEAGSMGKSNHPLMRLVRAKFEHTCMISDKVENVGVFVDKFLYEYRVMGIRFHTWRRLEMAGAGMCLVFGGVGVAISYRVVGAAGQAAVIGGTGAVLALLVFLIHMMTDEEYRLEAVRNYMVDYLENICQHRYEKAYKKEHETMENSIVENVLEEEKRVAVERSMPEPNEKERSAKEQAESDSLIWAMYKTEPLQVEDERKMVEQPKISEQSRVLKQTEAEEKIKAEKQMDMSKKELESSRKKGQDEMEKNQRIREILEEFMA